MLRDVRAGDGLKTQRAARLILVDDDDLTLRLLSEFLVAGGFAVSCYSSPLDALAAIEREQPDVIIADYMMPQVNGIALLALSVGMSPESGRILCTAVTDFDVAMNAVNAGEVHRIIRKPVRGEEIRAAVSQAAETVRLRRENAELNDALRRHNLQLEGIVQDRTEALLEGFVAALDARDTGTLLHSKRVGEYARRLAGVVGIGDPELTVIVRGSLLHDIGKIGIPDHILLKEGPLTDDEWRVMRKHPEIGWALLQKVDYLRVASPIVLQHHERWDGKGYPAGLAGSDAVIGARVFQVVDSYDAMTTDRPYRKRLTHPDACSELVKCCGAQFDPTLVDAFLSVPESEWQAIREAVERAAAGRAGPAGADGAGGPGARDGAAGSATG